VSLSGGLLPVLPIGLAAALALATPPPASGSDGVPIRVEFDAPSGCSSVDAFYAGLLTRMGRARRAAPGEEGVHLGVRLTRVGTKVRGELRMMDGPGDGDTRRVDGESCDAVVEVLSLTAALALVGQPQRATPPPAPPRPPPPPRPSSSSSPSSSTTPSSETPPKPPESTPAAEAPKPPEPPKPPDADKTPVIVKPPPPPPEHVGTRFPIGLQAVVANVNAISNAMNVGGGIGVRLERHADGRPRASVGVTFLYAPNDLLQDPDDISLHWTALAVTGCPPFSLGRTLTLQACAQGIGGWLSATGRGISNPSSARRTWWSAGALLRAGAHLGGRFALELEAGATVPLVARRFHIIGSPDTTVGKTPTIAPVIALGLSVAL
jgi:hypothetical protein